MAQAAREPMPEVKAPAAGPRGRMSARVIDNLVDEVVSGMLAQGQSLPIEPDLSVYYGVSRTVLREAVKAVEAMGLLSVRQGQGTSVRPIEDWNLLEPTVLAASVRHDAELSILSELVDVRAALEGAMAATTATRATEETRSHLTGLVGILHQATGSPELFRVTDAAFHKAIMVASGNRLAQAVIRNLTDEAHRSPRYMGEPTVEDRLVSNDGHDEILDAVLRGDADGAKNAMARHITLSWERRRPSGLALEAREGATADQLPAH